jgi:hypothetical protein
MFRSDRHPPKWGGRSGNFKVSHQNCLTSRMSSSRKKSMRTLSCHRLAPLRLPPSRPISAAQQAFSAWRCGRFSGAQTNGRFMPTRPAAPLLPSNRAFRTPLAGVPKNRTAPGPRAAHERQRRLGSVLLARFCAQVIVLLKTERTAIDSPVLRRLHRDACVA